jgi:hypothetical protein
MERKHKEINLQFAYASNYVEAVISGSLRMSFLTENILGSTLSQNICIKTKQNKTHQFFLSLYPSMFLINQIIFAVRHYCKF